MFDAILGQLHGAATSGWIYPALYVVAMLDGVVPVFPAETLVVTAGLYSAADGRPALPAVVALAAAGAFTGDHLAYLLGRASGGRFDRWMHKGPRRSAAFAWAARSLATRGGLVLVVARYVAGGRNAATMTMGAVGYRLRSFSLFDAVGAVSWALTSALLGYLGGVTFERHPLQGLAFGLGLAIGVTVAVESLRQIRQRRRDRRATAEPPLAERVP